MENLIFRAIGVERLRIVNDGPGITTLVAGHGCPLRCRYCLNPQCFERRRPVKTYSVEELIEAVSMDDLYFQATGGGVVFGGGEPLLQAKFIHAFRKQCPAQWNIYLESSLAVPGTALEQVAEDIDFFLIDIKDMNPEIYRSYTGADPGQTLGNLRLLAERKLSPKTVLRIPLIPEYNTEKQQKESMEILQSMGFARFDVFAYDAQRALKKRGRS